MEASNLPEHQYPGLNKKQRATMTFNGFLVIIMGSLAGFAWILAIGDNLELWPLPPIEMSVPDNKELWRNAHMGPIIHGMLVVLIAAIAPLLKLSSKEARVMMIAALVEIWGNVIGFQSAPFTTNRGFNPEGPFINILSYGAFYIAILAALVILYLAAVGSYRTMKSS